VTARLTELRLEILLAGVALAALLAAQWMLSGAIEGTNYYGFDGKMAQAIILTTFEFGSRFEINNLNPIEGVGSQLLPMNVWANPAYWPFAILDKELAADLSALVALGIFAAAAYVMARCFDVPVVASFVAAQSLIVLFAPAVLIFRLPTVFCLTPGNAVVYAPHMVALGLLGRLEPGGWRSFCLITAGIFGLLFYSVYCDPLWTMVNGISWSVAFAVVTLGPLRMKTILARCAALGCSVALLVVSGVAEYLYTLSQYTARVQFAQVLDRERGQGLASALFHSPSMKYYYLTCALGWLFGLLLLRGPSRLFVAAGAGSCLGYVAYSVFFLLLLNSTWVPPIPLYVEQCLFALFVTTAAAGYWGVLQAAASAVPAIVSAAPKIAATAASLGTNSVQSVRQCARASTSALFQRIRIAVIRHGILAVSRLLSRSERPVASDVRSMAILSYVQYIAASGRGRGIAVAFQFIAAAAIPAYVVSFALNGAQPYAQIYHERWISDPELSRFFTDNIRQSVGEPFRGSVMFWEPYGPALQTIVAGWNRAIPTVNEYSQLVSPQALYFIHVLLKKDVRGHLNWFQPSLVNSTYTEAYWAMLQMFGTRYFVGYSRLSLADGLGFTVTTLPHVRIGEEPDTWSIYELPHPNVGDYSPTQVVTARSGDEIMARIGEPEFDVTQQVVLAAPIAELLVPARDMHMSRIRGGLHVSGRSDGTSLVVLPQQFSKCLRARDERVRVVRANLIMTGVIFSGDLDTDIIFDYGIFAPACRHADLGDMKQLDLRIDLRMTHLSGDRLLPDWNEAMAKMKAIAAGIK
jgi:hypothetical protein